MAHETKRAYLESRGFIVGTRDPQRNTAFKGRYMVAEPISDASLLPTESARLGGFCIVGNNLNKLVADAYDHFAD